MYSKFDWGAPNAGTARDLMDKALKTLADDIADMSVVGGALHIGVQLLHAE